MSAHTPGPWWTGIDDTSIRGEKAAQAVFPTVKFGNGDMIARLAFVRDANLIAAAPDLLAALRSVACAVCEREIGPAIDNGCDDDCSMCRPARAAIAKAEGK